MPDAPKAIYRVRGTIPEIDAEPGDHVIVRPSEPDCSIEVVKRLGRAALASYLRGDFDGRMQLLAGDLMPERPTETPSDRALSIVR